MYPSATYLRYVQDPSVRATVGHTVLAVSIILIRPAESVCLRLNAAAAVGWAQSAECRQSLSAAGHACWLPPSLLLVLLLACSRRKTGREILDVSRRCPSLWLVPRH